MKTIQTDILIVGTGASGLFAALHVPEDRQVLMITKDEVEHSDSFLAQGGICVLRDDTDYDSFMEDTLKAGHYENRVESVDIMIRSSRDVIRELVDYGVDFAKKDGEFDYTREGCHSKPRILFHEDITGEEITSKLLKAVRTRSNVTILEHVTMLDLVEKDNRCYGVVASQEDGEDCFLEAEYTILATGGIGGLYKHSTNYPHLTGDALALALRHHIELEHIDYIQIHPTTLYSKKPGRRFLISESVRGEGAKLYGADGKRFANEVLPRDLLTAEIRKQMEKDQTPYVWLDMTVLGEEVIKGHFPHIYERCLEEGYDVTKDWIPVVPAQHYFMGGIHVDKHSKTSMEHLYAVGETSCNGVHGANRLASNSLLESLVFGARAARHLTETWEENDASREETAGLAEAAEAQIQKEKDRLPQIYREEVLDEIERVRKAR
ncbi:L-aspartate oxidase [Drancourtella massiliensis]|uniref:L-aspartate oxidase n=1 Tax=Drancourtella massiliensis TaxID=1632013 RepID=A0ABS2EJ33_9FIRM|nr:MULTISPECIES: L-aspartate oxidase [Clostridia]MBM6744981.1 L-aspartate oxidase [Drancourtella massiliensis]